MNRLTGSSLFQLVLTRFKLFFREPEAVFWIFVFPLLLALGLSIAFRNRPADVLQVAGTTPRLTQALNACNCVKAITLDEAEGRKALALGKIVLLVQRTADSGDGVEKPDRVIYLYDDTNPDGRLAFLLADRAVQRAAGQKEVVGTRYQTVHEAGARYIDFVIPGLLGMNLMSSAIWALGFSIVEARQKKLLKRLVASPMPRWQYLASFLLSRLLVLVVEVGVFLGFAKLAFGVPFRGSIWQLCLLCILASISFSAIGILLASRAKTMEAASGMMNLAMLPMWILSGVFFSASRFPQAFQPLIRALPLTAAIDALRGNMLQGLTLGQLAGPVAVMSVWLVVAFAVSLRIFRWR